MGPEPVRLGMVRLTDAAPLVWAYAQGMFAAAGVEVDLAVEPSWANVADKLSWGLLDGAVMLSPLAIAMSLGLRGKPTELIIPACVSLNGDAITLATHLADPLLREGRPDPVEMAARLRPLLPLRLAVVHAFSTQELLLRLFLERGGIDPAALAPFPVIPPADMVDALAEGRIDGFCAGAPWGAVAAEAGVGRTIAVSSQIAPDHPEKCLAIRRDWADANPATLGAVLRALDEAARACELFANGPAVAGLLAEPDWIDVPAALIESSLPGGQGGEVDRSRFASTVPTVGQAQWLHREMARWRTLPDAALARIIAMHRPDLHPAAMKLRMK